MNMARSLRGTKGQRSHRCPPRMSRGTAGKGACTSLGGRGGRRRSGTSTSCEPATGPQAAAAVKPGQVRHGHCSAPGLIRGWELPRAGTGSGKAAGSREGGGGAGTGLSSPQLVQQQGHHVTPHCSQPGRVPVSPGMGPAPQSTASSSGGSTEDIPSAIRPKDLAGNVRQKIFLDYSTYMARFVPAEAGGSPEQSPPHSMLSSPTPGKVSGADPALGATASWPCCSPLPFWHHGLGSRAVALGNTAPACRSHPAPGARGFSPPAARRGRGRAQRGVHGLGERAGGAHLLGFPPRALLGRAGGQQDPEEVKQDQGEKQERPRGHGRWQQQGEPPSCPDGGCQAVVTIPVWFPSISSRIS